MKACTVFHSGAIVMEGDRWIGSHRWPAGAYARTQQNGGSALWYVKRHHSARPINLSDLPKDVRLIMLLLGEPL